MILKDFDETSLGQQFRISRILDSDGVIKIHSRLHPDLVIGADCSAMYVRTFTDKVNAGNNTWWKIGSGGSMANVGCKNMTIDVSTGSLELKKKNKIWSQEWRIVSNDVTLMEAGGRDNQTWSPIFVDYGYDLALIPGFPGEMTDVSGESCLASTQDRDLAKVAMHICDKSMSVLAGSQASVGRLLAIAANILVNGVERMPGYCCMDVATNSEFFGYDVSGDGNSRAC